jgi:hypothetical protein
MVTTTLYTLMRGVSLFPLSQQRTAMSMTSTHGVIINNSVKKEMGYIVTSSQTFQNSSKYGETNIRSHRGSRIKALQLLEKGLLHGSCDKEDAHNCSSTSYLL